MTASGKKTQTRKKSNTSGKKGTARKSVTKDTGRMSKALGKEILVWILIAVGIILILCNFGAGGKWGSAISSCFFGLWGLWEYVFPFFLIFVMLFIISNRGNRTAAIKACAMILMSFMIDTFVQLCSGPFDASMKIGDYYRASALSRRGGGLCGGLFTRLLCKPFGKAVAFIVVLIIMVICVVLISEKSLLSGIKKGGQKAYDGARDSARKRREQKADKIYERRMREAQKDRLESISDEDFADIEDRSESRAYWSQQDLELKEKRRRDNSIVNLSDGDYYDPNGYIEPGQFVVNKNADDIPQKPSEKGKTKKNSDFMPEIAATEPVQESTLIKGLDESNEEAESDYIEPIKPKTTKRRKTAESKKETEDQVEKIAREISNSEKSEDICGYRFPDVELLTAPSKKNKGMTRAQLEETGIKLEKTLESFGVRTHITEISCGPSVTRYELQPEQGVKVSRILSLADDIKLNLAAADIRIEAPIPGKAAVGIEVPNSENTTVTLRELIDSDEFRAFPSKIAFAVGRDIGGKIIIADIFKMPHMLIGGATGSGKSVCINTLIMSILYKASPDEVKFIMIDPKMIELNLYNGIPHLYIPVVTDPKKAAGALQWAVAEMTKRYKLFSALGVRDLKGYNKKIQTLDPADGGEEYKKMPQIVIVVDEFADLMMVASGEVEEAVCRLAQLARAAGIHLILATQRPSVDVITGLIKANMPSRIALAVSSGVDSRTIIDMVGAEKLLGKGDMLFYPSGLPKPVRVQGAFVSENDVERVVEFVKSQNGDAVYDENVASQVEAHANSNAGAGAKNGGSVSDSDDGHDVYFEDAARYIVEKEKASIGSLQRVFKIGFNRAARIMDQLCEAGVVGEEEGTKPRRVLMNMNQLERMFNPEAFSEEYSEEGSEGGDE